MLTPIQNQSPLSRKSLLSSPVVTKKKPTRSGKKTITKTGRWETPERLQFLRGLRLYGKGKWKQISDFVITRNTVQVKTHGRAVLRKLNKGVDVFCELNRYERLLQEQEATSATTDASIGKTKEPTVSPECRPDLVDQDAARTLVSMRK